MFDIFSLLKKSDFFSDLPEEMLNFLAKEGEPISLQSGEMLIHQGDLADAFYLLCYGRLSVFLEKDKEEKRYIGEVLPGETVGEMTLLTGERRSSTVIAARNSTAIKFTFKSFSSTIEQHPKIGMKFAQILVKRMYKLMNNFSPTRNITVVTLVIDPDQPASHAFIKVLEAKIARQYQIHIVNEARVIQHGFDLTLADSPRLVEFLSGLEKTADYVLYVCYNTPSPWTSLCLRQADSIVFTDNEQAENHVASLNNILFKNQLMVPVHLVCLENGKKSILVGKIHPQIKRVHHVSTAHPETIDRFIRLVLGKATCVLLGGGGARSFAHIGILRALQERNRPIDMIGGVSAGAIIAAQFAEGMTSSEILAYNRNMIPVIMKTFRAYNLPLISIYSNHLFVKYLREIFGDKKIEELWLNYFCISCNLSVGGFYIHERGLLRDAIYATNAAVPLFPPAVLKGQLLVDGGFISNVPGNIIRPGFNGKMIGIDVSNERELYVNSEWDAFPSNLQVLLNRINPFARKMTVPGLVDMMMRAFSMGRRETIKTSRYFFDYFLSVPVSQFNFMAYNKIDDIEAAGYQYAMLEIDKWEERDKSLG